MNTTRLKTASERTGPAVLGAGVAVLTAALLTSGHARLTAAPRPAPTVTATVTAPAPVPARTTGVARPSVTPTSAAVVPVSDRTAAIPHNGSGGLSHGQARPPSTPDPSSAPAPCSDGALSVRLLRAACVSIGGDR